MGQPNLMLPELHDATHCLAKKQNLVELCRDKDIIGAGGNSPFVDAQGRPFPGGSTNKHLAVQPPFSRGAQPPSARSQGAAILAGSWKSPSPATATESVALL